MGFPRSRLAGRMRLVPLILALLALAFITQGESGCAETGSSTTETTESAPAEPSEPPPSEPPEESPGEAAAEPPPEESEEEAGGEGDEVGSSSHATDAEFCREHECIGEFETEPGTVVECSDGTYSHSGGISGACSDHGGEN